MADFFALSSFVPPIDKDEVDELIPILQGTPATKDIFRLSTSAPSDFADKLDDTPDLLDKFLGSVNSEADKVADAIKPVDPADPTSEEKLVLLGGMRLFYSAWPDAKLGALRWLVQQVNASYKLADAYWTLDKLSKLTNSDLTALITTEFLQELARYYIVMAGRYIGAELKYYNLTGRVLDQANGGPMAGVKVTLEDDNVETPRRYGSAFTNDQGYFRSVLPVIGISSKYTIDAVFEHSRLTGKVTRSVSYEPGKEADIHSFSLPFNPVPSASKTVASTGTAIPADVQAYLTTHSITVTRLEDIRRLGGFVNLPSGTINKENANLLKLDGLASLEIANDDAAKNSTLYSRGYTSISRIANTPRKEFVARNEDILTEFGAAQVHYRARAAHLYALNALAGKYTQHPAGEEPAPAPIGPATGCGCSDCASAVSPLAYLADLLCFTLDNVDTAPGTDISLVYLKDHFFQELGALPANCTSVKTTMCQNRIAAEILRKYYATAAISGTRTPRQLSDFATAQRNYLTDTYELLLNDLGTSYLELRRMRSVQDISERKRLSDRLGIVLVDVTDPGAPDTIDQLFIDLSNTSDPTEAALESLFGHRKTTPFSLNLTPEPKVSKWKKARLRDLWREQDRPDNNYWDHQQVIIDPDIVTVDDIRKPRTGEVIHDLWDKRRSWVDAEMAALNDLTSAGNTVDAFNASRMIVAYGRNYIAPGPAPSITYTTSTPSAFSQAFTVLEQLFVNGNTYYKVQQEVPRDMSNGTIAITGATPASHSNAGLPVRSGNKMIDRVRLDNTTPYAGNVISSGWPESSAAHLISTLRQSRAEVMQGLSGGAQRIINRGFTLASAGRLLELYDKHREAPLDRLANGNLTEDEWQELESILVAVLKNRASRTGAIWRTEESSILLGPDSFWVSITEPRAGRMPFDRTVPLLDPDLVGAGDVPEVTARKERPVIAPDTTSLDVLESRRTDLANARTGIAAAYATGFQQMLDLAFDTPGLVWDAAVMANNDYLRLLNRLSDPLWEDWARLFITERLRSSTEDLRTIISIGTRTFDGTAIPSAELEQMFSLLSGSYKLLVNYPTWLTVENGKSDSILRKARLPQWRASAEQRKAWTAALLANSAAPIIDADLIGPGDLSDPVATDRAFILWKQRWVEMHGPYAGYPNDGNSGWLHGVTVTGLVNTAALDALIKTHIEHAEDSLAVIREQEENGIDIRPRLAQLQLTTTEFAQLLAFRDILPLPPTTTDLLTGEEKTTIKRILAQVKKRRKALIYTREEAVAVDPDNVVTLSPDFFRINTTATNTFPPTPEHPLTPWLAVERDLIAWRRTLRGRVEQEESTTKAWEEVLLEVDDAMMVNLRDALTQLCGAPNKSLLENARAIGDKLLIDLENNCCYKTNRVAAGIETLQQLLWKTRTGDILADHPTMEYRGEDFDEAWTWMGSYANWRAAMFVFLYPENVLIPGLRKEQTPAFQALMATTRSNRRFGPDDACAAARAYRDYLVDVADLELKCSAEVEVFVRSTGCGVQSTDKPRYLFAFAQGRTTFNSYYSTVDTRDKASIEQNSYWQRIPGLDDTVRITGCSVFFPDRVEEFIYLFFTRTGTDNADKFFALRFNLLNGLWEDEPLDFQVEIDDLRISSLLPAAEFNGFVKEQFSPKIQAMAVRHNTDPTIQPTVAVSLQKTGGASQDVYTFYWPMHDNGKEFKPRWDGDGWRLSISGNKVLRGRVRAFVGLWADERARMMDHSLFVLSAGPILIDNPDYLVWLAQYQVLQQAKEFFNNHCIIYGHRPNGPFTRIYDPPSYTLNGEVYYGSTIDSVINSFVAAGHPPPKIESGTANSDYLAYVQILGESNGPDTIYIPPAYSPTAGKEIRFLLPFYERSTFHLEVALNGDRRQDVVAYSTIDANTPIVTNEEPLAASVFPPSRHLVAPVRDLRYFDRGNNAFEDTGGLLLHQEGGGGSRIGISWHGKSFNHDTPVHSTMQVTSLATVLTPALLSVPVIQSGFTAAELDLRRSTSQYDLGQNTNANFRLAEYVHEAYYFVPVQIALQLSANGYHQDALDWFRTIYDINRPLAARKIYYGLTQESQGTVSGGRAADWYSDPLNPHAIAALRPFTYTRYTVLAIAQCLLAYADAQFTVDTSETVPRAREMYEDAIALLNILVPPDPCPHEEALDEFHEVAELGPWTSTFDEVFDELEPLTGLDDFTDLVEDISTVLGGSAPMEDRLASVRGLIATAQGTVQTRSFADVMVAGRTERDDQVAAALSGLATDGTVMALSGTGGSMFGRMVSTITGRKVDDLPTTDLPWLMNDSAALANSRKGEVDRVNVGRTGTLIDHYSDRPAPSLQINSPFPNIGFSGLPFTFCVVANPIVQALLMTAEVQLWKIHNCMNIAGLVRELDPFAAPTDSTTGIPVIGAGGTLTIPTDRQLPPSAYRYRVIVDRAKQLVSMAQQVESAFLATLEKLDAERYSLLRAEQDIESTKAQVKLQDLKVSEANDGVALAELQKERAVITSDHFEELLDRGNSALEIASMSALSTAVALQIASSIAYIAAAGEAAFKIGTTVNEKLAASLASISQSASATSNLLQLLATFERRKEEWEFQKSLATQDVKIGDQQIKLAQDRVRIVGQERAIAGLQNDHAKATLDFLKNKFTSAELYEWMSGVLEGVYNYFLQEATATALLAQRQLAFERQLDLPPFIRTDYWIVDAGSMGGVSLTGEGAVDRRGITGSARLLRDLTDLDQHAFSTNTPKLQMSRTISLNEIAPEELIRLRDQGVMTFRTTQDMFDRDYPGHYLRLIKKVNVTVIALIPPTKGIRATLTNGGVSRVVTGGTIFQERVINRYPEQIALSSGVNDYGVFQLRNEGEFLDPFEGTGVDALWEFRMEKAANPFDFGSIADVLVTIEYEALNSFTYRQTVVQRLNNEPANAGLAISFKNNLPDQWFDLHNPDQAAARFAATFEVNKRDLLPNIQPPHTIDHVAVYFLMKDGEQFDQVVTLSFNDASGYEAQPNENLISTRSNAQGLVGLQGLAGPEGTWTFKLADSARTALLITEKKVEDILLVITYGGNTTPYSN